MESAKRAAMILALPFLLAAAPPPPAPVLIGQVVDGAGRPVAGAQVRAVALDSQRDGIEPPVERRTGKDGRFRLEGFPAGTALVLEASAEGFAPSVVRTMVEAGAAGEGAAAKGKPRPPLRIVLGRGSTLTGRVVDPQGQPAGGAEVVLSPFFTPETMFRLAFGDLTHTVTTDPKGRFRIERLGGGGFQVWAEHPSFAAAPRQRIEIPEKPAEIALGDVRLVAAAFLEGRVTDERGAPVAGASVTLRPVDGDFMAFHEGPPVEPVQTGADGQFRSGHVAAGTRVNVSVEHPGYVDAHAPGVEVPRAEPLLVTLQAGRSLSGRVVDPSGKPVAGARLTPSPETGLGSFAIQSLRGPRTESDGSGRFLLDGLSPGPLALWVMAEGYLMKTVRGLQIPETGEAPPVEIVLGPGATVEGRVLDEGSRPVAGAFVHAIPAQGFDGESWIPASGGVRSGEDGRYRVGGLPPGRFQVAAQTPEGRLAEAVVEIPEGTAGVHPLDLRLDSGSPVSGRVLDDTGAPVAGASLQLAAAGLPRVLQKTSGADGSFLFPSVPAGSWRLSAAAAGFTETGLPGEIRAGEGPVVGIELRLERGGTVTGQVLGLTPEDFSRVQIYAFRQGEGTHPQLTSPAPVDSAGRYRITGLRPGTWKVLAMLLRSRQAEGTIQVAGHGEESVLDLRFTEGATLSGRLLLDGGPLAGAMVVLTTPPPGAPQGTHQTVSLHDGSFSVEGVPPGSYRLILMAGLVVEVRLLEVAADQEVVVELASGAAEVTVLSAAGTPLKEATLEVARQVAGIEPFQVPARLFTDDRGFAALPRLAAGTYVIQVRHAGGEAMPQEFHVTPGGTTAVQVVMP